MSDETQAGADETMAEARPETKQEPRARREKAADKPTAEITYIPGDGDPHSVKWNGITFKAHIPTVVAKTHAISVGLRKDITMPDGTVQSRSIESRVSMVELARKNPSFVVDGERMERKAGTARVPEDNDQYRGYAVSWIANSTSAQSMDTRWDAEQALRVRCGCIDGDIAYLRPFFEARRDSLKADAA